MRRRHISSTIIVLCGWFLDPIILLTSTNAFTTTITTITTRTRVEPPCNSCIYSSGNRLLVPTPSQHQQQTSNGWVRIRQQPAILKFSTVLCAKLWERLQIEEDLEPRWYLLNCVATNEIDLLRQCRTICQDMDEDDVGKFVVPTLRQTRSHGPNKMVTETKVKYPGYVFAKLRLCEQTYEAIQELDLCRSWMGTVNHKGYKKLPPAPLALNELEVENFGLEDMDGGEDYDEMSGKKKMEGTMDADGKIFIDDENDDDEYDDDPMYKNIDRKELKQYAGVKVGDYIKVIGKGKYGNEDGIVRRLKDGKFFIRFYTYGTMFEDWLEPSEVRKLTDDEVLKGLRGPSQPITQRDIDGSSSSPNAYQKQGDLPGDLRKTLTSNTRGLGAAQRNRRQDRVADQYGARSDRQQNEYDRRNEDKNWNWYKEQQQQQAPADRSIVSDDQWTMRSGSGRFDNNDDESSSGRNIRPKSPPRQTRNDQPRNNNNRRTANREALTAAIDGTDDWSAFVSPAPVRRGTPSNGGNDNAADDFFSSLMSDLSNDLDNTSNSGSSGSTATRNRPKAVQQQQQRDIKPGPVDSPKSNEDDFFASLLSELTQESSSASSNSKRRDEAKVQTSNKVDSDDFFATLMSELKQEDGKDGRRNQRKVAEEVMGVTSRQQDDDFFASLDADLVFTLDSPSDDRTSTSRTDVSPATNQEDGSFSQFVSSVFEQGSSSPKQGAKSKKKSNQSPQQVPDSVSITASSDFGRRTVPELKEMLRERGLKVSGKKSELIERLMEA